MGRVCVTFMPLAGSYSMVSLVLMQADLHADDQVSKQAALQLPCPDTTPASHTSTRAYASAAAVTSRALSCLVRALGHCLPGRLDTVCVVKQSTPHITRAHSQSGCRWPGTAGSEQLVLSKQQQHAAWAAANLLA